MEIHVCGGICVQAAAGLTVQAMRVTLDVNGETRQETQGCDLLLQRRTWLEIPAGNLWSGSAGKEENAKQPNTIEVREQDYFSLPGLFW